MKSTEKYQVGGKVLTKFSSCGHVKSVNGNGKRDEEFDIELETCVYGGSDWTIFCAETFLLAGLDEKKEAIKMLNWRQYRKVHGLDWVKSFMLKYIGGNRLQCTSRSSPKAFILLLYSTCLNM